MKNSIFSVLMGRPEIFSLRIPGVHGIFPYPNTGYCNTVMVVHDRDDDDEHIVAVIKDQTIGNVTVEPFVKPFIEWKY